MIPTYAVIPTHDRLDCLRDCVQSISGLVDRIIIIDNSTKTINPADLPVTPSEIWMLRAKEQPPNISRLWNYGIIAASSEAKTKGQDQFNILVLNDDVVCPPDLAATLSDAMRRYGAALAYPDQFGVGDFIFNRNPIPVDIQTRITGYAYMLRGELGLRLDERFAWWYGDDDLDWIARIQAGSLLVPGVRVEHKYPNAQTNARPELLAQTTTDRQTFIDKWGRAPH